MATKRVLMTVDTVGGVWQYALDLARGLVTHRWQVVLVVMGPAPSPSQRQDAETIDGLTLFEHNFALEWMPHSSADVARAGSWLLEIVSETEPDIVHFNGYFHASLPFEQPRVIVAHSCVGTWWQAVHGCPPPAGWRRYLAGVAAGLSSADVVVAPTHAFLEMLVRTYGPLSRCRVIRNGRDSSRFTVGLKRPVVLTSGRLWDEAKNVRLLSRVAPGLAWPVLVAGETAAPNGVSRLECSSLRILGKLDEDEMQRRYATASIFALPALYEPFGLAILEAALSSCALVLGDIPTQRELWDGAARFVPPNDSEALERELDRLIRAPERVTALGRAARRRALGYSAAGMAEEYAALYASLLSGQPSPSARHRRPTNTGSTELGALE